MRDFSIDLVWAKIQGAITVIGGWLGYFLGGHGRVNDRAGRSSSSSTT